MSLVASTELIARHRLFFTTPALWSFWPFLPVVRRTGEEELGVLFDARTVLERTGYSATVFLCNLYLLPPTVDEFLALPQENFDDVEELFEAGWRVD